MSNSGTVIAFEASPTTYRILEKNSDLLDNIESFNIAVSDSISSLVFYEFPNLYSEFNSFDITQYKMKVGLEEICL